MTSPLFSPIPLRESDPPNRIVVSPMCQYSAEDGSAADWHLIHLGHLSSAARRCSSSKRPRSRRSAVSRRAAWASTQTKRARARPRRGGDPEIFADRARDPARARRAQGLERGAMARGSVDPGRPRRLAAGRALRRCPQLPQEIQPEALDRAGMKRVREALRRRGSPRRSGSGSTLSSCTARTVTCCTSSCRRSPTGATTSTADPREPDALSARVFDAVREASPLGKAARRADLLDRLDGGWLGHRGLGSLCCPVLHVPATLDPVSRGRSGRRQPSQRPPRAASNTSSGKRMRHLAGPRHCPSARKLEIGDRNSCRA